MVPNVCVRLCRPPVSVGTRTVATTVAWCTSNPAQREITRSMGSSSHARFGGASPQRICSTCSQQQYGVPHAPASDYVRTLTYHSRSDVTEPFGQNTTHFHGTG